MVAASDNGLHKLVIIGGGPAGIGVFIRAARTGFLPRLLHPQLHGTQADSELSARCGMEQRGVAIVHDGDASTLGAGNLGGYLINSNTFAKSLLSSVLDEKPELDPPESIKGTFLEHAREHDSTQRLERIGLAPVSLVDMGNFLTYVGGEVMKELARHSDTSACLLNTRATKFEVLETGVIRVETQRQGETVVLHTEHLALAMGGRQELPTLDSPALAAKLFTSETCLREDGFAALRDHLLRTPDKKVVIVGGSHSSFSVAWMLLNKFSSKALRAKPSPAPAPEREQAPESVTACHAEEPVDPAAPPPSTPAGSPAKCVLPLLKAVVINPVGISGPSPPSAGKGDSVRKPSRTADAFAVFKPKDITILHRTPIRCYYPSKKDAEADGADSSRVDRSGCVNTFTGLREDAKNLFKDVRAGKETRVRLFQVNKHGCQNLTAKAYESASAIVWCCGYKTRMIPAFDASGNALRFREENGVVKLDLLARLQLEHVATSGAPKNVVAPFGKVYGLGLGFSLRAALDEMGTETRADGVTVYHRRGAALVLAAMFGPEVFGSEAKSFEEMVEKNDRKKRDPQAAKSDVGGSGVMSATDKVKRSSTRSSPSSVSSPTKATPPNRATLMLQPPTKLLVSAPRRTSAASKAPLSASSSSVVPFRAVSNHTAEHAPATNPPVKLLLERRRSADLLSGSGDPSGEPQLDAVTASTAHREQQQHPPPAATAAMMKRAAFGARCAKKAGGGARHSASGSSSAGGDSLEVAAATADAVQTQTLETPTGSSSAPSAAETAAALTAATATKLADVNARVTRPVRLLHESTMLELFQEQLRSPTPVRLSAPDVRASLARQPSRPTVILYEAAATAEAVEHEPRHSNWLLPLAAAAPAPAPAGSRMASTSSTPGVITAAETLEAFDTAQQRECQICFDQMDALQAHVCLDCGTSFCSTCMQWYVEFKILDGEVSSKKLVCPAAHCTRALAPELVEAFASQETFAKYESFVKNQRLGVRFCPRAGCCAALDEPPFSAQRKAKCGACDAESCMRCGGAYHRTRLCRRVDKRYGKWKRHHNVRACPSCKADIEKQGGCSHMKCFQCDQEFCWSCLRAWDNHDETLCIPLAFYHSKSRKYGCWAPLRFVTKSAVLGVATVVVVAGAGVAVVVLPPLIGYHLARDSLRLRKHQRGGTDLYAAAVPLSAEGGAGPPRRS